MPSPASASAAISSAFAFFYPLALGCALASGFPDDLLVRPGRFVAGLERQQASRGNPTGAANRLLAALSVARITAASWLEVMVQWPREELSRMTVANGGDAPQAPFRGTVVVSVAWTIPTGTMVSEFNPRIVPGVHEAADSRGSYRRDLYSFTLLPLDPLWAVFDECYIISMVTNMIK
jgi:hypothetical protein